ncbi:uncharacterized protein LOC107370106 [Tetranychus urticae]|uniref:uncharacterized protein LOC107370106 n=1 Tax=Tetranychus urticae TaxID=32264 RepID=UPI00077C0E15|nr:uncharacterized protein LOC107370106 [Tetranychus urticae]
MKQIITINLVLLGLLTVQVEAAQIISFNVTSPVENGTSSVILDCNFIFDPLEENLVMKWYFNDNPRPVYQWIIALRKRSYSEEIRRHIDPDFTVDNQLTEHRAIRLIKPTTQLSGNYKCTISSVQSSDSASAKLIVYAPAKSFSFRAYNESTVLCRATGLYPSPVVELYRLNKPFKSSGPSRVKISKEGYTVITGEQGKYSIESSGSIDEDDYNDGQSVHYQCHLSIPDTNYSVTRNLTLTNGWNQQKIVSKSNGSSNKCNSILMAILMAKMFLIKFNM